MAEITSSTPKLFSELYTLITDSRQKTTTAVNTSLTFMYWQIG